MDALDSAFAAAKQAAEDRDRAIQAAADREKAKDRSYIAKLIVWFFVILAAWVVIAVTVGAYLFDWGKFEEASKVLVTILSSVILPVVTLVIGYYFGQERK